MAAMNVQSSSTKVTRTNKRDPNELVIINEKVNLTRSKMKFYR